MNDLTKRGHSGLSSDTKAVMAFVAQSRSVGVAYLLWVSLGLFGGHRFYFDLTRSGLAMAAVFVLSAIFAAAGDSPLGFIIIFAWLIVDAFLIPGMTRSYNNSLISRIDARFGS